MTLEQAYFLSGVVAAVGVIASVVYLAVQVRQNTNSVAMATGQAITEDLRTLFRHSAHTNAVKVVYNGYQNIDNLQDSDRLSFFAMMHDYFFAFQNAFFQKSSGTLDERYWKSALNFLNIQASLPGVRSYWSSRGYIYDEQFREFMDREVFGRPVDRQFNLAGKTFERDEGD